MQALYILIEPATRPMAACARLTSAALVGALFVAGCVTNPTSSNSPSSTAAEIATPPATVPRNVAGTIRLSWDGTSTHAAWSAELLTAVRTHKPELDKGNPDVFIPGYAALTPDGQAQFWAEFVIAVAKFESNWDPHSIYHEPPPLGVDSVGLLQLSYEDQSAYQLEPLDRRQRSLEDPLVNLRCGVEIMAHLIARDRVVATGANERSRGAAAYWSVLREGSGHHLAEIKALTKKNAGIP